MGEYIRIFEYSNILVTNIYLDIRSYQFFFYEYIRTFVRVKFVCTNIFRHSLVSVLECKTLTNIRIYSNIRAIFNTNTYSDIRSCQKKLYEYIRIFIRVILLIRIYSDIHSYQNFHECHTLVSTFLIFANFPNLASTFLIWAKKVRDPGSRDPAFFRLCLTLVNVNVVGFGQNWCIRVFQISNS